jgi:hypothetical protein
LPDNANFAQLGVVFIVGRNKDHLPNFNKYILNVAVSRVSPAQEK